MISLHTAEPSLACQFEKIISIINALDAKFEAGFDSLEAKMETTLDSLSFKILPPPGFACVTNQKEEAELLPPSCFAGVSDQIEKTELLPPPGFASCVSNQIEEAELKPPPGFAPCVSNQIEEADLLPPPGFHGPFIPFMGNVEQTVETFQPYKPSVQQPTSIRGQSGFLPSQADGVSIQTGALSIQTKENTELPSTQPGPPVHESFEQVVLDAVIHVSSEKPQIARASASESVGQAGMDKLTAAMPVNGVCRGRRQKIYAQFPAPKEEPPEDNIISPKEHPPEKERWSSRKKRKKVAYKMASFAVHV